MTRSITIQAETVEKAIEEALFILQLTLDEVHVHVKRPARTSIFGLRKVLAEVTVSRLEQTKETIEKQVQETPAGVRIHNGQLEARFGTQSYPIIVPSAGVELRVNSEESRQRTIILPSDIIECTAIHEDIAAQYLVNLSKDLMTAAAKVTPGKRITRRLLDSSWKRVLDIQATEDIEVYNQLTTEDILEELDGLGIVAGIKMSGIIQAVNTLEMAEIVIAEGMAPIASQDARLDIHLKSKKEHAEDHERVDFREHNFIPTVKAGQLIATYIPAVQGKNGLNLLGKEYKVKPPKEVIVRPGPSVDSVLHKLYAKIDGRPVIEWRGKVVKVSVNREYRHAADVNLESGNIHFEGDVWIGGSVHPSMFIAASGEITVMKNCTKASIRGTKSVYIKGSIFSSTVTVGIQEKIITMMVNDLEEILKYLRNIELALRQIFALRGEVPEEVPPFTLKQAIQLLLEQKYSEFTEKNKHFIQLVKNHTRRLDKEWLALADWLYQLFIDPQREEQTTILSLRTLIQEADELLQLYSEEISPESVLQASFALNSILYSNGNIQIRSKGVYNCSITALHDITIKGVCRGGEVIAGRYIELDETGSAAGVKTHIQTSEKGVIRIARAHPGTVLQIGSHSHEFFQTRQQVTARLNEHGALEITQL
ncbi:DUF342 domain-containing protein [Sporosarcina sp. P33]|uniref:DUF342 domain-containing protein n=1 Tax=Sporosarcina sp. P33 TaxID=1930764 RepID=UPI0009C3A868|nr:flagellar assembly protein A [Sporosarcina sp. P33]ARD47210.1 hypothetical protein SporoP33_02400 [Sporosarcina sp. P33]